MNTAQFVLDKAATEPEVVKKALTILHQKGETVSDILEFVIELEARKIKVPHPGKPVFDVCGTGGSGKSRINLSTALAIRLSGATETLDASNSRQDFPTAEKRSENLRVRGSGKLNDEVRSESRFCIAKHGNKAASGRVGSFDVIEKLQLPIGDTPEKVSAQLADKNLSFVFAPAFHPALKPMAPIRQSIGHPTIFNYLGPLLNPVPLAAQMIGVPSLEVGDKLAEVCAHLGKNAVLVHDTAFGLDDVSIGGATRFWAVGQNKQINSGAFFPEDYGFETVKDFSEIAGGDAQTNQQIIEQLLAGTASKAQQDFLAINYRIAEEFFVSF